MEMFLYENYGIVIYDLLLPHLATLRGEVAPVAEVVAIDSAVSLKRMGLRSSK